MSLRPLITICGTTGVGKSKLAIELALALANSSESRRHGYHGARIINADSMQVYSGMDIITNKVPIDERCGVEHLLMGFKQPGEQYVVGEWIHDAMAAIDETHRRNQVPIVVGGTSYWIQHLMFPNRLASFESKSAEEADAHSTASTPIFSEALVRSLASLPPELVELFNALPEQPPSAAKDPGLAWSLHTLLAALDPFVAQRWHWKDTRKVLRSLCIIRESGQLSSEIIKQQAQVAVRPRYRTLCFWLYAKPEALNPRLDLRVDQMIQQGLLKEINALREIAAAASNSSTSASRPDTPDSGADGGTTDYTLGIYQSIGYKEFHDYLNSPSSSEKAFNEAVDSMKVGTRQYARRQVRWIRNKLLPETSAANAVSRAESGEDVTPTYLLDATDLCDAWTSGVQNVAEDITHKFLEGAPLPDPLTLSETASEMLTIPEKSTDPTAALDARRKVVCPTCTVNEEQPVMIEEGREWAIHVKTRLHRRLLAKSSREVPQYPRSRGKTDGSKTTGKLEDQDSDSMDDVHALFTRE